MKVKEVALSVGRWVGGGGDEPICGGSCLSVLLSLQITYFSFFGVQIFPFI